jgi:tetratricopeptide (TPR) repeat protein
MVGFLLGQHFTLRSIPISQVLLLQILLCMITIKKAQKQFFQVFLAIILLLSALPVLGNDYQKAWEALARNDRDAARSLLEKALKDPATAADAALTMMLICDFDGQSSESGKYWKIAVKNLENPYPYMFPLWFNEALAGDYGQKSPEQVKMLKGLMDDPKCPGTLKMSAQYSLGHHYLSESKFKEMLAAWNSVMPIAEWQFVGPFDNLSGSGFEKNYPPIAQPEPDAMFKSTYNADIQWFKPSSPIGEGSIVPNFYVRYSTGIVYAQTFVTAPSDLETTLAMGFTGNIRVWVNDRLILSEQEYRRTDFDLYKAKCQLKKGVNRVLVQIGFEDNTDNSFFLRFVDDQANQIPGLSSSAKYTPYVKDDSRLVPTPIPFFAEKFLEEKIKNEPENLLNYILLCSTYLRSGKNQEGLAIILKGLQKAPENNLLHIEHIMALIKTNNRTELTQALQRIKEGDPTSLTSLRLRYQEEMDNERYDEAATLLNECAERYGEDEDLLKKRITLASAQNKIEDLTKLITEGNKRYPDNAYFNQLVHNVELYVRKSPQAAIAVNVRFLKRNYAIGTLNQLIDEYFEVGQNDKAVKLLVEMSELFPWSEVYHERLFNYYYGIKDARKAKKSIDHLIGLSPYHASYHKSAALLYEQMGDKTATLEAFKKALHYNPNDSDSRRRIRELQNQTDLATLLPKNDPYELIKNSKGPEKSGEYNWYTILDERATILYPERCSEKYFTTILKVLNEKGIESWKETSLSYNSWRERLIVEKAEVVKPNGSKFAAEQNDNELVFTNLAVGDAIYLRFRIQSYVADRMAREHWDRFAFNKFVPLEISRFAVIAPKDLKIDYKTVNAEVAPTVREESDFKVYTWETRDEPTMKHENLMPRHVDVGKNLYISTILDWQEIANWYADLSAIQSKQDYDVQQAVQTLFPAGENFTPIQKAQKIYEYVVKNISYSSISFRQSAYVPQKASKVLQTKLGDCKDLSTLYAAMAREAGLESNLVLINTRDNGEASLPLPSVEFNHCIVKVMVNGEAWYLELTDAMLPFGSLPNYDVGSVALEIPFNGKGAQPGIFRLFPQNRTRDYRHLSMDITVNKQDLNMSAHVTTSGALTRGLRESNSTLNREKQIEGIQESLGGYFSNPVTVKDVAFGALNELRDTLQYDVQFNVRNEVIEIGDLQTFRIPFYFVFLKADAFQEETRVFPINYWDYEDSDEYHEDIRIEVPAGRQITDIPKDVALRFGGIEYKLTYTKKSPTTVHLVRHIKTNRSNIQAKDYAEFRIFLDKVLSAENKYIAFK